jgi:hypothetical protein
VLAPSSGRLFWLYVASTRGAACREMSQLGPALPSAAGRFDSKNIVRNILAFCGTCRTAGIVQRRANKSHGCRDLLVREGVRPARR